MEILGNWCFEWLVKVNLAIIGNCALYVHRKKRIVERCAEEFRAIKYELTEMQIVIDLNVL